MKETHLPKKIYSLSEVKEKLEKTKKDLVQLSKELTKIDNQIEILFREKESLQIKISKKTKYKNNLINDIKKVKENE